MKTLKTVFFCMILFFSIYAYSAQAITIKRVNATTFTWSVDHIKWETICDTKLGMNGVLQVYVNLPRDYDFSDLLINNISVPLSLRSSREANIPYHFKWGNTTDIETLLESYSVPSKALNNYSNAGFFALTKTTENNPAHLVMGNVQKNIYFTQTGLHSVIQDCVSETKNYRLATETKPYEGNNSELLSLLKLGDKIEKQYNLKPLDFNITTLQALMTYISAAPNLHVGTWVKIKDSNLYQVKEKLKGGYLLVHFSEYETGNEAQAFYLNTTDTYSVGSYIKNGVYVFNGITYNVYDKTLQKNRKAIMLYDLKLN